MGDEELAETMARPDVGPLDEEPPRGLLLAGRYELRGLLGAGAMGNVFRARDLELREDIALKVLKPELARDPSMIEAFRREVRLARKVSHPNVARTFDIGSTAREKFLTMELVEGESLGALLERSGVLTLAHLVTLAIEVCAGLSAAHAAGIVHQDLKPHNVMVDNRGRVVVMDFGIARAIAEHGGGPGGTIAGTPAYMSPEQVEGARTIGPQADIYALGAMLFECVTGRLPFEGSSGLAVAAARLLRAPPDPRSLVPDLPADAATLILRCLARAPEDRFASADDVAAALRSMGARTSLPPATGRREPRWRVAVLPMVTSNAADAYLADGIAAEVIDLLAPIQGLDVAAHGITSHVATREADPRAAARVLGAQVVLHGRLEGAGDRMRVGAQLVTSDDGIVLWKISRDLVASRDMAWELATEATRQLGVPAPASRASVHAEALDLYMRGRHLYHQYWVNRNEDARALLARAHDLAPDFASATTGLVLATVRAYALGNVGDDELARAQELIESELARDPRSPEARLALASLYLQRNEVVVGAEQLRRCLAVAPKLPDAQDWKGRLLVETGPIEAGIRALDAAAALEPRLVHVDAYAARGLVLSGDFEGARERVLRFRDARIEDGGAHWILGARIAFWMGDRALFDVCAARARATTGGLPRMGKLLDVVEAAMLRPSDPAHLAAARAIRAEQRVSRTATFFAQRTAEHAGALSRPVDVVSAVRDAVSAGLFDLAWLDGCPLLACARDTPEFVEFRAVVAARAERIRSLLVDA